jgi:MSHA pilin protein MshD
MCNKRASGFTLVEMIIAIVIISVGLAGVLTAFNITVKSSADPMIRKQMLSIAEEMMEEILLKPFASQPGASASGATICGTAVAVRATFDDVSDYATYQTNGICDIDGGAVSGLETYNLTVKIEPSSLDVISASNAKKVTVEVRHGGDTFSLVGWRTWYACELPTVCPP